VQYWLSQGLKLRPKARVLFHIPPTHAKLKKWRVPVIVPAFGTITKPTLLLVCQACNGCKLAALSSVALGSESNANILS